MSGVPSMEQVGPFLEKIRALETQKRELAGALKDLLDAISPDTNPREWPIKRCLDALKHAGVSYDFTTEEK